MSQRSQVSRITLCVSKVKVPLVSEWVSQWQGHPLSCFGQLKRRRICFGKWSQIQFMVPTNKERHFMMWYQWQNSESGFLKLMNISLNPLEFLDGGCDVKVESYQGISSQILGKWARRNGEAFQGLWNQYKLAASLERESFSMLWPHMHYLSASISAAKNPP